MHVRGELLSQNVFISESVCAGTLQGLHLPAPELFCGGHFWPGGAIVPDGGGEGSAEDGSGHQHQ